MAEKKPPKKPHIVLSILLPTAAHQEDVGNGIQDDKDNFGILGWQQTEKRLKHIWLNEEDHLLDRAPTGEVSQSPDHLFLSFVVTLKGAEEWQKWATEQKDEFYCIYKKNGVDIPVLAFQSGREWDRH